MNRNFTSIETWKAFLMVGTLQIARLQPWARLTDVPKIESGRVESGQVVESAKFEKKSGSST